MKMLKISDMKRQVAFLLIAALLAGILLIPGSSPARATGYGVSSPRIDSSGITTWDCIWFGNYWQEDTNRDGRADKKDARTSIKWRVLSVEGDDALLVADKNLDCQRYNDTYEDVTWETCTLRSWLNGYGEEENVCKNDYSSGNFMDYAFTAEEQEAIQTTDIVNNENLEYGTDGGNNTSDQVYLLSIEEATNPAYGFSSSMEDYAESRRALNTAFTKGQGAYTSEEYVGNGYWWLRSPGSYNYKASYMFYRGNVYMHGNSVHDINLTVRPALHLNLSSVSNWSYAGTVTSDGKKEEPVTPTPTPTPQKTKEPETPTPTPQMTEEPEITSYPQITYDLKVNTSGAGAVTLKTSKTTVTTDGNASINMKVNSGEDVLLSFQPSEESGSYTFTIDGEEGQAEGNTYRISNIQSSHTVVVTFIGSPQPTPVPTPTLEPTPTPIPTPIPTLEPPGPTETPEPTGTPMPSAVPSPTVSPVASATPEPTQSPEPIPSLTPVPQASQTPLPDKDLSDITDGLGVSPDTAVKIQTAAKELDVPMDTILVTEQTIQSQKTDQDIKGAYFARIQARASQITEKNIKLTWNRVKGADGYEVYGNRCNTKKWIYEYKLKKDIKSGNKKSYIDRKCKKGTYYKYIVRAYKIIDGKKVTIAAARTIHVTTNGGKNGNAKSVKVNKNKVILKVGKTWRIKAKEVKESRPLRHHREVSYESSRPKALSVSRKGVIKAKKKGKYTVFAYAQNGIYRKVQITVK